MPSSRLATGLAALAVSAIGVVGLQSTALAAPEAPKPKPSASNNCPNPAGHYPPGQCKPKGTVSDNSVERNQKVHVHGEGFKPNSDVKVYLDSTYLGTFRANGAGVIDGDVVIPGTASYGDHKIMMKGFGGNGQGAAAGVAVKVVGTSDAGAGNAGAGGSGPLPRTGAEIAAVALLGGALVTGGGIAVAGGRRRRLAA